MIFIYILFVFALLLIVLQYFTNLHDMKRGSLVIVRDETGEPIGRGVYMGASDKWGVFHEVYMDGELKVFDEPYFTIEDVSEIESRRLGG